MLRVAVRKENPEELRDAGDYCINLRERDNAPWNIEFICPHADCGDQSHVPLAPAVQRGWNWDEATKTLSPSIKRMDAERCEHHFSLINGEWVP